MNIEGKVALVTGGASGLGRATVEELHRAGASVVVVDLAGKGEAFVEELRERAVFAPADVTSEDDVRAAVNAAAEAFGALHVAVSCAGIGWAGRVVDRNGPHSLELFQQVVNINLIGTFNVIRLAAERMTENEPEDGERGVLVNTASIAAFDGQIGQVAYAASKGGVVSLTLPVARDLGTRLIRCVTIAPGTFDTPMMALMPQEQRDALAAQIPHPRRLGKPSEFASLVRHAVENPMLNGEVIRLDGAHRMPPK